MIAQNFIKIYYNLFKIWPEVRQLYQLILKCLSNILAWYKVTESICHKNRQRIELKKEKTAYVTGTKERG